MNPSLSVSPAPTDTTTACCDSTCCTPAAAPTLRPAREGDRGDVLALLESEDLEADFAPGEFLVAEQARRIVACGRLKPLPGGAYELASVAVAPALRATGLGRTLVKELLAAAGDAEVYALALASGFFAKQGFVALDATPDALKEKAEGVCASRGFVPMRYSPREAVHAEVRAAYGAIAKDASRGRERPACCGDGYTPEEVAGLPEGAYLNLGTGNPVRPADLKPGETVVDLGSGAGVDVFLAARHVGPTGRAIGIDLTPEMIARAQAIAKEAGIANAAFHLAPIEKIPLSDETADAIISNCVINLSPDKAAVLSEAYRILKPGGRFVVSDMLRLTDTPGRITCDCEGGALSEREWRDGLAAVGFTEITIERTGASASGNGKALVRARKS